MFYIFYMYIFDNYIFYVKKNCILSHYYHHYIITYIIIIKSGMTLNCHICVTLDCHIEAQKVTYE